MSIDAYASVSVRYGDTVLLKVASHRSLNDRVCAIWLCEVHMLSLLIWNCVLSVTKRQSPASVRRCFELINWRLNEVVEDFWPVLTLLKVLLLSFYLRRWLCYRQIVLSLVIAVIVAVSEDWFWVHYGLHRDWLLFLVSRRWVYTFDRVFIVDMEEASEVGRVKHINRPAAPRAFRFLEELETFSGCIVLRSNHLANLEGVL